MELCQIWLELHHRVDFLFDCTPSLDGVSRFTLHEMDILFARKAFIEGIHSFLDTNTFAKCKHSFPFSFLPFVS